MRDLIKELENLKYAGKLIPEAPLFRGDFTPLVRIRKTHKWFRLMKNNDGQHFMSENSKPFQLADEDLTNVFVSLAKIIGQVELIINGQYGELTENSDELVHEIKRNACRTLAYWYQLMQNIANQKEEELSHIVMFLHDSRSSSNFVSGYTHLMLEQFSDELNGEQRQALATIAKYWEQAEQYWQYLLKYLNI